jgi:hypothetical protein
MTCDRLHDSLLRNLAFCQFIYLPTIPQYHYALTLPDNFLQFRADKEHSQAFLPERLDQPFDLGLCSNVDPASRLVENKQLRLGRQPSSKQDFLLITSAEIPNYLLSTGRFDIERLNEAISELFLFI